MASEKERRAAYLRELETCERHPLHGTRSGYSYGCRCDRCKAAIRAYELERKAKRQRKAAQPTGFMYAFPEHRDVGKITKVEQALKIMDECVEFIAAITDGEGEARELEELCDIDQAWETLARRWGPEEVWAARNAVVAKNDARGYYDKGVGHGQAGD